MNKSKWVATSILAGMFTICFAEVPHTWHTVNATQGTWLASLKMINEEGHFVNLTGDKVDTFQVSAEKPFHYGFVLGEGNDFNVAYTLTMTQESLNARPQFSSKTCLFLITASGPAKADIRPIGYNGAVCSWKNVPGVGEDFFVG